MTASTKVKWRLNFQQKVIAVINIKFDFQLLLDLKVSDIQVLLEYILLKSTVH